MESIPCRVFTSSRRPGVLAPGPAPSRFSAPSTTSPRRAPCATVRPGPSRFRSQAFSASQRFPGRSWLRGLVSCRCRPWGSPFRAFVPRRDRVRLSASLAPLQFSTVVPEVQCARPRPPGFTDSHAHGAVAWIPTRARTPFPPRGSPRSRVKACRGFPGTLGLAHRTHPVPAASSASKLCSPRESALAARPFRDITAAGALLGFAPPEP